MHLNFTRDPGGWNVRVLDMSSGEHQENLDIRIENNEIEVSYQSSLPPSEDDPDDPLPPPQQ